MKKLLFTIAILVVVVVAGTIVYMNRRETSPSPVPLQEPSPEPTAALPETNHATNRPAAGMIAHLKQQQEVRRVAPATSFQPAGSTPLIAAVDVLVSPQSNFQQKEELRRHMKETGELDQVIAELKQRAANNPNDPQVLTALGESSMFNLRTNQDFNERAILALQADQNFAAALKIDPANWEAQFYKAQFMSHWPESLHKDDEVVQRLTDLAAQQETMPSEPQFARTYIILGDEYQKLGKSNEATQTWQLGAQKFPNDPALQKRLNGQSP